MIGRTLHHYRILRVLGKGGMGEVYAAEDTKLHREVALKVLPLDMASDTERLQRFQREARAVAALNHPNVVTVYAVEEAEGVQFITMELVEGKALGELIPEHGLPLRELLRLAVPLADAVAAAHQRGIVHRDLKPANIMVTAEERLKVLDFGLAKLKHRQDAYSEATTLTAEPITKRQEILGTPHYMSPEQAQGLPVDHRADIFSLGVILYQMATGTRPFQGSSVVAILSAVIKDTPAPVRRINPSMPLELEHLIAHCLAKNPADRYQSVLDLCKDLGEVPQVVRPAEKIAAAARAVAPPVKRSIPRIAWLSVVLLAVAGFLVYLWSHREAPQVQADYKSLTFSGSEQYPSLSPDGKLVVYSGLESDHRHIFLQDVGGRTPLPLTEGSDSDDDQPVFSRDGKQIAFWSSRQGGGIFVMGRTGENVRKVAGAGFNPSWSPDGSKLVYSTSNVQLSPLNIYGEGELYIVDTGTGVSRCVLTAGAVQPTWSPHDLRIAYRGRSKGARLDIYTMRMDGSDQTAVTNDEAADWSPAWAPDGKHLYFASDRGGTMNLWRVRIDEASGKPLGEPEPITTPAQFVGHPSLSADGLIAYCAVSDKQNIQRIPFDPVQEKVIGEPEQVTFGLRPWSSPDISPDGQWLAFYSRTQPEGQLYVQRADGTGEPRQLTNDAIDRIPRWSPDGNWIAFFSNRSGAEKPLQLWKIHRDGSGLTQLTDAAAGTSYFVWSDNGSRIATRDFIFDSTRPWDQQIPESLPPPEAPLRPFIPMSWSPDGERLLGQLTVKERANALFAVYSFRTRTYESLGEYGEWPVWLRDGRRLLCVSRGQEFVLVDTRSRKSKTIHTDASGGLGPPRLPRDQSYIYYSRRTIESVISLATLK